jgi:hypothetical protein
MLSPETSNVEKHSPLQFSLIWRWIASVAAGGFLSFLLFRGGLEVGRALGFDMPVTITEDTPSEYDTALVRLGFIVVLAMILAVSFIKSRKIQSWTLLASTVIPSAFIAIFAYLGVCQLGGACYGNNSVILLNSLFFATQILACLVCLYVQATQRHKISRN